MPTSGRRAPSPSTSAEGTEGPPVEGPARVQPAVATDQDEPLTGERRRELPLLG